MIKQLALNDYVNTMSSYSSQEADKIREADSETANIMRIKQQVAIINRETEHIKETGGDVPPTWKMNYLPRLNIV
jgi:hypothetical protein